MFTSSELNKFDIKPWGWGSYNSHFEIAVVNSDSAKQWGMEGQSKPARIWSVGMLSHFSAQIQHQSNITGAQLGLDWAQDWG